MRSLIIACLLLCSANSFAKITLALNWKPEPEFGGFYQAQLSGYFKEQGLDVEILPGGSGTPTVQMLANNKVDFAIVSADEIILSQDRNSKNKVKALFAVYQKAPYIVMTHAERNFKNLKEVFQSEGTLAMQSGLPYYQYLVKKFGKPKVRVVPYLGGIVNFMSDKNFSQQGFLTTEPLSAEKAGTKVKNFLIADEGFNPYLVVVATTETTLKNHSDTVRKLLKAVEKGWQSYLKDPAAADQYMAGLNKSLNLETFKAAADIQKPLIEVPGTKLGTMTDQRWNELVAQLKDLGLIKSTQKASDLYQAVAY